MSGLGNVLGIPVYSVSTFDALRALAPSQMAVLAMLDARRDQVYVQCTDADGTELIAPAARPLEGVLHQLADVRSLYITGDALVRHEDCIREALPHAHLAPAAGRCPDAAGVCTCVFRGWAKKETFDTIKPVYLRRPQAERERLERAQREQ